MKFEMDMVFANLLVAIVFSLVAMTVVVIAWATNEAKFMDLVFLLTVGIAALISDTMVKLKKLK